MFLPHHVTKLKTKTTSAAFYKQIHNNLLEMAQLYLAVSVRCHGGHVDFTCAFLWY